MPVGSAWCLEVSATGSVGSSRRHPMRAPAVGSVRAVCEMWIVAGLLLLMWASVLCVWRCAGVRRARAVRECVLESRVRLRCCARAGVGWLMYCVVRLFTVLCGAGLAGRAARWAAARCGWLCAREMVCGGRSARPSRSAAARGAGMWSALYVRLLRGWRAKFPCNEGRAQVFTLWARCLLYTSPSPRDLSTSRMPSSA